MVLTSGAYSRLQEVRADTSVRRVITADLDDYVPGMDAALRAAPPGTPIAAEGDPDDVALFQYTGGTTGVPRAAMLTHQNLVVNAFQFRAWMASLQDGCERVMAALPLFIERDQTP